MARLLQIGSYTFPAGFRPAAEPVSNVVPHAKRPRTDGANSIRGTLDGKRLRIEGDLMRGILSTVSDVNAALDSMKAALFANTPASLFFGRDDRYYRFAQLDGDFDVRYMPTGYNHIAEVAIPLFCGDPFQYSTTTNTDTWTVSASGSTRSITPTGTAYVLPTFSITVGSTGTIAWTITNNTNSKSMTLAGAVTSGDVIVVDCLNKTVTIAGVDKIALFDGVWIELIAGANTIQETYTGPTITQIVTTWQNRWY